MVYRYSKDDALRLHKHGIDLTIYSSNSPAASVVHVSVKEGHFQEFYDISSTYIYYVEKGEGTFYLNGEAIQAKSTDLIVVPPKTRIYYFGEMELVLTVAPAFNEKNERHVRFIDKSESPYTR